MSRRPNNREENQITNDKNNQKYSYQYSTRPIKSPSPDRKPTNIIISTKSPEISQYKRESTSSQAEETPKQDKEYPNITSSFKQNQTYETSKKDQRGVITESRMFTSLGNSRLRNIKIEIAADYPEEFEVRNNSSISRQKQYSQSEYQRMLKSKDDTIRQLKSIIELIKRNNHNSNIIVQQDPSKYQQIITELNSDVKELKIENQYLLKVIQKSKYMTGDNNKDAILEREIRQLRQSLRYKDIQIQQASKHQNKLRKDYESLEKQNFTLLKILKQRDQNQNKHPQDKDKLSLIKIKEQHQENLRITNQLFQSQIKSIEEGYFGQIDQLNNRLQLYNQKINKLQYFKYQYETRLKSRQGQQDYEQKQRHRQIQSILLSKTTRYQKQINFYKNQADQYSKQLLKSRAQYEALSEKYLRNSGKQKTDESVVVDNVKLRQQYDQLQQRYNKLKENNDFLNRHNKQLDKQYEFISEKYNQQLNQISYLNRQLKNANDEAQKMASRYNRLTDQNNYLQQHLKDANRPDEVSSDKFAQLAAQNQNLAQSLAKLKQQYRDLQQKYKRSQSLLDIIKNPSQNKQQINRKKLQQEISELKTKNEIQQHHLQNLQQLYNKQKQSYFKELSKQQNKIQVLLQQYQNNLKEEKRKNQQLISHYERKLLQEKAKLQNLNEQTDKDKLDTETKMRRAFELYDQEIQTLKGEVNKRNQQIYSLTVEIQRIKKQNKNKLQSAQSYEKSLQSLISQYNNAKEKCKSLQSNTSVLQQEIIELDYNLSTKTQQNRRLSEQNKHLNQMIVTLRQQLNRYMKLLKEKDNAMNEANHLKIQINQYLIQINQYNVEISKLKQQNYYLHQKQQEKDKKYNDQFITWRRLIEDKDRQIEEINYKLNERIKEIQQKNKEYQLLYATYETIQNQKKKIGKLNYESIQQQLKQLKKYIQEHLYTHQSRLSHVESIEDYYKLTGNYELKIEQNSNLLTTIQELKTELLNGQKQKLLLNQKISFLQNNIMIYERQLKERKQIYEQLLLEKIRIQKDLFLSRRLKVQHNNIEDEMKRNVSDITQRIDKLLEIQRERNQQVHNMVESTTKVITISKSNYYKEI